MVKLEGRVAVITGGGRGMGEAVARRLVAEGAKVSVTDVDAEGAKQVAKSLGDQAIGLEVDVRSWSSVEAAADATEAALGPIDILVNCAGVSRNARAEELPRDDWDLVIDVNLTGTWRCCQVIGARMAARRKGAIVNIGSAYTEIGAPGRAAYAATKTGVLGLTRVLATEWASRGVRVNVVEPGYIDTPMLQVALAHGSISREQMIDRIPAGRIGDGDEVARTIAFLVSDDASYVTGESIRVDGGHLAYGGLPPASVMPDSLQ
jgi:NAD(P)-dependent dehydrogenase (short-subunit alcohol dehydrogenase family)